MRTVIFSGLTFIADAIREGWATDTAIKFGAIVLIFAIVFDVIDFFRDKK